MGPSGESFLRRCVATSILIALAIAPGHARADGRPPLEHEPILPDPANDVAMGLRLDGDLPPAIETTSGLVAAPDPRESVPPVAPGAPDTSLAGHDGGPSAASRFRPDTDTSRPDTLPYSDPFTPSTAPWKRLVAFDMVDEDTTLRVRDAALQAFPIRTDARNDATEERFYGDLVVDLVPDQPARIPSVGPEARVVHARLGVGAEDIPFQLLHDSADNWFIRTQHTGRARLVYELSIARAAFGGAFDEALDGAAPYGILPPSIQRDTEIVARQIGVPKATRRDTLTALVSYFRSFTESNERPSTERGIYLALALSKKGVCRHRAYAFMVTATGLGFRTRVVMNEAHAWVEVHDGRRWKRIDLGGAGTLLAETAPQHGPTYAQPPDPFEWPAGARRGEDLGRTAQGPGGTEGTSTSTDTNGGAAPTTPAAQTMTAAPKVDRPEDTRVAAAVTLASDEGSIVRGQPLHVGGSIAADGAPCAHVAVVISARERKTGAMSPLGELVTDARGDYRGSLLVPRSIGVGDYELVAVTQGDARCGRGTSP
jgi:transglutaminase-like putative cysteine protease